MVTVRITKKIGRLSQGTVGTIKDSDHANYGVGKPSESNYVYPRKISFFVDGNEWTVENTLLEKVVLSPAMRAEQRQPKRQLALI